MLFQMSYTSKVDQNHSPIAFLALAYEVGSAARTGRVCTSDR